MGKNIVITGGLGYIGTELCKIYSGESWNNNILVLDNRFVSERVRQLNEWGIQFVQGDILDPNFTEKHINDAHIIHHLAGITDVAKVSKESNKEKDQKLNLVAIQGTSNVLSAMNYNAKIIFPSISISLAMTLSEGLSLPYSFKTSVSEFLPGCILYICIR